MYGNGAGTGMVPIQAPQWTIRRARRAARDVFFEATATISSNAGLLYAPMTQWYMHIRTTGFAFVGADPDDGHFLAPCMLICKIVIDSQGRRAICPFVLRITICCSGRSPSAPAAEQNVKGTIAFKWFIWLKCIFVLSRGHPLASGIVFLAVFSMARSLR